MHRNTTDRREMHVVGPDREYRSRWILAEVRKGVREEVPEQGFKEGKSARS